MHTPAKQFLKSCTVPVKDDFGLKMLIWAAGLLTGLGLAGNL